MFQYTDCYNLKFWSLLITMYCSILISFQEDRLSIIVFFILSIKNSSKNCDNEVASKATHRQQAHPDRMKKLKRLISVLQVSLSIIDINPQYKWLNKRYDIRAIKVPIQKTIQRKQRVSWRMKITFDENNHFMCIL